MKTRHLLCLVAVALLAGCQTGRHAQVTAKPDAPPLTEDAPAPVIVKGNVMNSVVEWTEDLTVARAIVAAEYLGVRDPVSISIRRQGERFFVNQTWLLLGLVDPWLDPGDVLELHTSTLLHPPYDLGQYRQVMLDLEAARARREKP